MHDTVRAIYRLHSITEGIARLINVKQQENEYLMDYVKRFKQLRDVVKSQIGTKILDEYVSRQQAYKNLGGDPIKEDDMKIEEWDSWMAYCLLRGADQNKYGSLMKRLAQSYSLKTDDYPNTITGAVEALSNHKLDQKFFDNQKKQKDKSKNLVKEESSDVKIEETSFNQSTIKCYCCGEEGHGNNICPKKDQLP